MVCLNLNLWGDNVIIANALDQSVKANVERICKAVKNGRGIVATPHASANGCTPWGTFASILVGEVSKRIGARGRIIIYDVGKLSDNRYEPGRLVLPGGKKIKLLSIPSKKWSKYLLESPELSGKLRNMDEVAKEMEKHLNSVGFPQLKGYIVKELKESIFYHEEYREGLASLLRRIVTRSYQHVDVLRTSVLIKENLDFLLDVIFKVAASPSYHHFLNQVGSLGRRYRDLLSDDPEYDILKEKHRLKEDIETRKILPSVIPFMALLIHEKKIGLHIGGEHMIHYVAPLIQLLSDVGFDTREWKYFHVGRATATAFSLSGEGYERKVDYTSWRWGDEDRDVCNNAMLLPISYFMDLKDIYASVKHVPFRNLYEKVPILITP